MPLSLDGFKFVFLKRKMYSFAALCDKTRSERWFYDLYESYFAAHTNASKATKLKLKQTKKIPARHYNLKISKLMSNYSLCVISALLSLIDVWLFCFVFE